jgi:hypothetical protein
LFDEAKARIIHQNDMNAENLVIIVSRETIIAEFLICLWVILSATWQAIHNQRHGEHAYGIRTQLVGGGVSKFLWNIKS